MRSATFSEICRRGFRWTGWFCGDVGFGKTEVALRAAVVNVRCPGGVDCADNFAGPAALLQFHAANGRFFFPLKVRMLSRLQTATEARKVKEGLKDGSVDIVIGTHALLANNIEFSNLGLLIIDEEQHFGVAHKEKPRKSEKPMFMCADPDGDADPADVANVLTGVKQLSIIATPPVDRLAARTL